MANDGARRPYSSALRERHVEQTRDLILQALAQEIASGGIPEFSVRELAARAGLSPRTVYRHFPNRELLLEGLAEWVRDRLRTRGIAAQLDSLDGIEQAVRETFRACDEFPEGFSAVVLTSVASRRHDHTHDPRTDEMRRALAGDLSALDPEQARRVFAVIRLLVSARAWYLLREEFGLDGDESAEAVVFTLRAILAEARRRPELAPRR